MPVDAPQACDPLAHGLTLAAYLSAGEHHAQARACLERQLAAMPPEGLPGPGADPRLGELLVALSEAQEECNALAEAQATLARFDRWRATCVGPAAAPGPLLLARAALEAARLAFWRHDFVACSGQARQALAWADGGGHALTAARAELVLSASLSSNGQHEEAEGLLRNALRRLDDAAWRHCIGDRVRATMNLGITQYFQGRHDEALLSYRDAAALAEAGMRAGSAACAYHLARTWMNWAAALVARGEFGPAVPMYRRVLALYATLLQRARRAGTDLRRLETSRATTRMNLGYCLYRGGELSASRTWLGRARRDYRKLGMAAPQLQDDLARTWVNEARVLLAQGRAASAARLCRQAVQAIAPRATGADSRLAGDLANHRMVLACALAVQGRHAVAAAEAVPALDGFAALTAQGQLQHAQAWLTDWLALADTAVRASTVALPRGRGALAATALFDALHQVLARPPQRASPRGDAPLRELNAALGHLARWQAAIGTSPAPPAGAHAAVGSVPEPFSGQVARLAAALVRYLLDVLAAMLGDADPAWIAVNAALLTASVEGLRLACDGLPGRAELLADWFLCTRGLRAQRDALAQSDAPRVQALAHQLLTLHRLEESLLARYAPADGSSGPPAERPNGLLAADAAQWFQLKQHCDAERDALAAAGVLPPRMHFAARQLGGRLAPGIALCLLARPSRDRLLVVLLQSPADGPEAAAFDVTLPSPLADADCGAWIDMARQALAGSAGARALRRTDPGPGPAVEMDDGRDVFALEVLGGLVATALAPVRRAAGQQPGTGWHTLALVPSDDLHVVPWRALAPAGWPGHPRLLHFPSVGAWWRQASPHAADRRPPGTAQGLPRWLHAVSAPLVGDAALPWVAVEAAWSAHLWRHAPPQALDAATRTAEGVDALIGMGHGVRGSAADATAPGLRLDADHVLTAHDLPRLRHVRQVLLSSCVLGQTQDVLGEPLGFLSAATGYGVEFGSGWLTEVPDDMACLFSLAFQFGLARDGEAGEPRSWLEVFDTTCHAVGAGAWPAGFGAWLSGRVLTLPPALHEAAREWPESPPALLRRLLPWVIAVGC